MRRAKSQDDATLLDILIDGFEKNEILDGFHERWLPMSSSSLARAKFDALSEEVTAWKGVAADTTDKGDRASATWADLELRQAGRGILVRVRAPWFGDWWHAANTWDGDPMDQLYDWLAEDRNAHRSR